MSILNNAVDSIAIGLEDYSSTDGRRMVSCARNIFAGILLLFKYKLSTLSAPGSDEVLIKQRVLPSINNSGDINWVGKGKKTVDVQNIKDRFSSLDIEIDWKRLDKVNAFRNDIEHYYSNLKRDAVQALIADSFVIIRDFIANHLNEDPKTLLGDESWSILIKVSEVYEKEKLVCEHAIENLNFFSVEIRNAFNIYNCVECGSGLIMPDKTEGEAVNSDFTCKSCDETLQYEYIANVAVPEYYSYRQYRSYKDGDDIQIIDCPLCIDGAYIVTENVCSSCGYIAESLCKVCSITIPPEEISESGICGYCLHMMAKND